MPRSPRVLSESGYMHIYSRGNSKQILFEQRSDYVFYLNQLKRFSSETAVTVCAFCLMENHVHLLVYDKEQNISGFMRKLNMTYSGYFNQKYGRSGHLFEGRFKSLPIESEEYLLKAFRYILNNPRQAGLCRADEYPWSSYSRYGFTDSFVDTSVFVSLIGETEAYKTFISAEYEDCPELENTTRNDEWARSVIRDCLHIERGTELQEFDLKSRNDALRLLKKHGLTIRQIERLTGINHSVIQRA